MNKFENEIKNMSIKVASICLAGAAVGSVIFNDSFSEAQAGTITVEPEVVSEEMVEATVSPTVMVTEKPIEKSVYIPTKEVTIKPTVSPTEKSIKETVKPTVKPSVKPSVSPTKKPVKKTSSKYDYSSKFFQDFDKEDRFILYRIVEAEAGSYSYDCRRNVAAVIFNRLKSDKFPDSVYDVVFQKKQFSPIMDGRYWTVEISDTTKQAVIDAYNDGYTAKGCLYFANLDWVYNQNTKNWFGTLDYKFKDSSGHTFYK